MMAVSLQDKTRRRKWYLRLSLWRKSFLPMRARLSQLIGSEARNVAGEAGFERLPEDRETLGRTPLILTMGLRNAVTR